MCTNLIYLHKNVAATLSGAYARPMSEERTPYIVSRVSGKAAGRPRRAGRALRLNGAGRLSADAAGFPGCTGVPMDAAELAREDSGRIEYWDADDGVAWMVREATATHERPAHRLPALLDRIAEARGADIVCCGATTFYEHGAEGERVKAMEADQTVYLDAGRGQALRRPRVLGTEPPPDLVLEVDHTTDVRRRKLCEYARWRFPEVWVEVPPAGPGRRQRRRPGMTIHLLEADADRYREAKASRALPGWTAEEIHLALNEPRRSAGTRAALERVGRALGDREGTTPTEDPRLRDLLVEARAAGRAEGRAAGKDDAKTAAVRAIFDQRGIPYSPRLFAKHRFAAHEPECAVAAALACDSAADFLERLDANAAS